METLRQRHLRILAADDSAVMRGIMRTLFLRHAEDSRSELPRMELAGVARDGVECLDAVTRLAPDVLVLDLEMPRLSGLEVLDRLRETRSSLPVIMCSSYTECGARTTLDALARGASDYVMKPTGQGGFESALSSLAQQLLPRIAALARGRRVRTDAREAVYSSLRSPLLEKVSAGVDGAPAPVEVVVIGVSTGGPAALEQLLPRLPAEFPVPVLIVQHMPKLFTGVLAERLNRCCPLRVEEAWHGAQLKPGTIWIAPGDAHMEVMPQPRGGWALGDLALGASIKLHWQDPLNHCRPSVDYLFHSAARLYGAGTVALMLTGMGSDGLDGARAVHASGGVVLAQDEATSAVWGMPGRVVESGIATAALPISTMAREVNQRVNARRPDRVAPRAVELQTRRGEVTHGLL